MTSQSLLKDPETQKVLKKLSEAKIKLKLEQIEQECKSSKQNLSLKLKKDWNDEFATFLNQVKDLNQQLLEKQKKQKASLAERVAQSITSKESEAREAIKVLFEKNKMQMDSINIKFQHHPNAPSNEQKKAAYLNQIQSTYLHHQNSINRKLEQYKVSKKAEYDANRELLEKHHHKRKMELTAVVNKNKKRLFDKQTLQRLCHEELEHEKQRILTEQAIATRTNHEPRQDNPKRERISSTVSAIHRYETRKRVLDQKHSPTSFVVDIHTEGLHTILVQSGIDEERILVHDFLPWGHKAYELMHCLICGEFPLMRNIFMNYNSNINELQGGQVKCTVTDLRCKIDGLGSLESHTIYNESANTKNPKALRKIIAALKQNMDSHSSNVLLCENLMNKNRNEMRRSEQKLHSLQSQTKTMLKPGEKFMNILLLNNFQTHSKVYSHHLIPIDGTSNLTTDVKRKLDSAFAKFENEISIYGNKAKELQHNLALAQKRKSLSTEKLKNALKEYQQAEKSQATSCKNYEDDNISKAIVSLKRGIFDRCTDSERRKNNKVITLRPTKTSESYAFREFIKKDHSDEIKFMIRAEELYLLAVHPSFEARLSLLPNRRKVWAEPGYQLLHHTRFSNKTNRDDVKDLSSEFNSIKSRQLATLFRRFTTG